MRRQLSALARLSRRAPSKMLRRHTGRRRLRLPLGQLSASLLVGLFALSGCETPELHQGISVRNETEENLTFQALVNREVVPLPATVGPQGTTTLIGARALGEFSRLGTDGCTTVDVIAVDPGGNEIARAEPPLCVGDEWVVQTSE